MPHSQRLDTVLVTGGAGYVGSVLVPRLLAQGYRVRVLDLFLYGGDVLDSVVENPALELFEGDIRDEELARRALEGCDAVIHLACISNDPSFELDPELGRSINLDAFRPLVELSRAAGVRRFVYASSSSVYGLKDEPNVHEELELEPLTEYSRYKADCETILAEFQSPEFTTVTLRPATVCGYSPRQRLDVVVNVLTSHAVHNGKVKVFGGEQKRPNIHIEDMAAAYVHLLEQPDEKIAGKVFNVGGENHTVGELATIVRDVVGPDGIELEVVPTDDNRSYHISSTKIEQELGFQTRRTVEDAVRDLVQAFESGQLPDAMDDPAYYNIRRMQEVELV
jgi:nucleoside-diphosphate-sugar epimerase